jgi:tRNA (mo5U34)-methyltransferase
VVLSFNRPQYLEPVLQSLRAQSIPVDSGQITLFQDGYRSKTGRDLTDPRLIERCVEIFQTIFPGGHVVTSTENLGVAWNFARAERYVFEELGADAAYFFEDDLVLSDHYLTVLAALTELALKDRRVAYVAAYGDHRATLSEQRLSPNRLMLMRHKWGFSTTRRQWEAQRDLLEPYLDIVGRNDYGARDQRAIRDYFQTLGYGSTGSSQDAMKDVASCVLGTTKIMTFACFARYIGEVGMHSRKQTYDEEGFANTEIYPEAFASFVPPSDQQLDDWVSYTRRNARRILEAGKSPELPRVGECGNTAQTAPSVEQSSAHPPSSGREEAEAESERWYPSMIACESLAHAQNLLNDAAPSSGRVARLEKLFFGRDKSGLRIAEFGVWQGRTSVDFIKFLGGSGELHLFDFADNVRAVTGMMEAAGYKNVFGHGRSYKYLDSYNWSLKRIMETRPDLRFDYVYLDGAHTWAIDGLTFLLCDMLLNERGYVEFDDYDWSLRGSSLDPSKVPVIGEQYTEEQIADRQVKAIVDLIVRRKGYYTEVDKNRLFRKSGNDTTLELPRSTPAGMVLHQAGTEGDPGSAVISRQEIVDAAYRAVLGRAADTDGLQAYSRLIEELPLLAGLERVVGSLLRSQEFRFKGVPTSSAAAEAHTSGGLDKPNLERQRPIRYFHSFEFSDGETISGIKPLATLRREADVVFSEPIQGKRVLDIGAWDGYFSFEAEKRGASHVLATDHFCWSGPGWGTKAGFDSVHAKFRSKVQSLDIDVFDLDPKVQGTFDLVLFLGVLYHLKNPFGGIEQVYRMTRDLAIIETQVTELENQEPVLRFYQGRELNNDGTNFFAPNHACLEAMLREVGFKRFKFSPQKHPASVIHGRTIVHAWR